MKVYFGVVLFLTLAACSTNIVVPEEQRRGVAQMSMEKVDVRELDELRWQIEIYQNGGPKTHYDLKEIRKSTDSQAERIAKIRSLECDPATRTVPLNHPDQSWSVDPCFFSGLPQWNLFSWNRFNIRKVPTTTEQFKAMVVAYDVENQGNPEEIYEVTMNDKRRVLVMNTSLPNRAAFKKDEEAAKKLVTRNGRLLLLRQVNATQFKVDGEIVAYRYIPESL